MIDRTTTHSGLAQLRGSWAVAALLLACESGGGGQDGFETGPCVQGACLGGLVCVADVCVDPHTGDGDGSGGSGGPVTLTTGLDPSTPSDPSNVSMDSDPSDDTATGPSDSTSSTGPAETCPTTNDGVCDEPEGTGLCPEGTDEEDCALPSCTGDPMSDVVCNQWLQDCPAGDKCMPWANNGGSSWNALGCFPLDCDPVGVGEICQAEGSGVSGTDNCEQGAMCWAVDGQNAGYCVAMCEGMPANPSCAATDSTCAISNQGVLSLCLPGCNPLAPGCFGTETCAPINDVFVCAPDASGALGAFGDPCEYVNSCDAGLACLGTDAFTDCAGATGCCAVICDLSDAGSDAMCAALDPAQTCVPWYVAGMEPPGLEDVGVCSIAP